MKDATARATRGVSARSAHADMTDCVETRSGSILKCIVSGEQLGSEFMLGGWGVYKRMAGNGRVMRLTGAMRTLRAAWSGCVSLALRTQRSMSTAVRLRNIHRTLSSI